MKRKEDDKAVRLMNSRKIAEKNITFIFTRDRKASIELILLQHSNQSKSNHFAGQTERNGQPQSHCWKEHFQAMSKCVGNRPCKTVAIEPKSHWH